MRSTQGKLRSIIESHQFTQHAAHLIPDTLLRDEALRGLTFNLARSPDSGRGLNGNVWVMEARPHAGAPALAVYYTFDANRVLLLWIERRPH